MAFYSGPHPFCQNRLDRAFSGPLDFFLIPRRHETERSARPGAATSIPRRGPGCLGLPLADVVHEAVDPGRVASSSQSSFAAAATKRTMGRSSSTLVMRKRLPLVPTTAVTSTEAGAWAAQERRNVRAPFDSYAGSGFPGCSARVVHFTSDFTGTGSPAPQPPIRWCGAGHGALLPTCPGSRCRRPALSLQSCL